MTDHVRVLIVEDDSDDAELMLLELRKAGFDPEWWRVENRDEFIARLEVSPDVILSDHHLPEFDSGGALDALIERQLDIPLIIVSGAIGETAAVEALQRGAVDYVIKDRLSRLGPAVRRGLRDRDHRAGARWAEAELRRQTERYRTMLDAISDLGEGLVITEAGKLVYCNRAYQSMTGYSEEELGSFGNLIELAPEELRQELGRGLGDILSGKRDPSRYLQSKLVTKDGRTVDVESSVHLLPAETETRILAIVRDITERRRAEAVIEASARVDPLTGVPNRRAWDEELARALARAERADKPLCVAVLDLDHFKSYNDDWGHQRGDRLLREVAGSWLEILRGVDFLARYGGDEFGMIVADSDLDGAEALLERLAIATPEHQTVSVGLAEWDQTESAEDLVARADAALLDTKHHGRRGITRAAPRLPGARSANLRERLVRILADRDLVSAYQPIVQLDGRRIVGYEALARPAGDAPDATVEGLFEAAKRFGFARDLDWLSRRSAFQNARAVPSGMDLFVNVGVWALFDPLHPVDQMLMLLRWAGRKPTDVVLEISERDPITDFDRLREVLESYRAEGFRFALDDVGEGHSTLEVMAAANAEFIKIARSLTTNATAGAGSEIQAVVTFARASGARIVSEGIEDEETAAAMLAMGVDFGQGYAFGRPQWLARPIALDATVPVA